jgi:hypothetical protein
MKIQRHIVRQIQKNANDAMVWDSETPFPGRQEAEEYLSAKKAQHKALCRCGEVCRYTAFIISPEYFT